MKFRFDHIYTMDKKFVFREKLRRAGFFLKDGETEHPGKAFCRFIYIPGPASSGRQCLEFVHIGKGGVDDNYIGLSLNSLTSLDKLVKTKKFKKLKPALVHKNYNWKENDTDRLPGWNYLNFPKHKSRIYSWLTEFENIGKKRVADKSSFMHANKVSRLVAVVCDFSSSDEALYVGMLGSPKNSVFKLSCGTLLEYRRSKSSRINFIVFASKNLKSLVKKFEWDELTVYEGQSAVRIKNPNAGMWDVLIIQG